MRAEPKSEHRPKSDSCDTQVYSPRLIREGVRIKGNTDIPARSNGYADAANSRTPSTLVVGVCQTTLHFEKIDYLIEFQSQAADN